MINVHPTFPRWLPAQLRKGWLLSRKINRLFCRIIDDSAAESLFAVEGQINARQCAILFYFAYSQDGAGRIVEIGSFKGKSTVWLAKALQLHGSKEKVLAVDPHINTRYDAFLSNVSKLELSTWVEPVRNTSEQAAKNWNQSIKLLFIDGSHRYEDVLLDLQLWVPWVKPGGVIIMDDTDPSGNFPGVLRAINEYLRCDKNFKELLQSGKLTVFEKTV